MAAGSTDLVADRMARFTRWYATRCSDWIYYWFYWGAYRLATAIDRLIQHHRWRACVGGMGIGRGQNGLEKKVHGFSLSAGSSFLKLRHYPGPGSLGRHDGTANKGDLRRFKLRQCADVR